MPRTITREMPPLTLRASFVPSTIDVESRRVQVTWTTGARVLRGFFEPYYEELSLDPEHVRMGRLQSGAAPLLSCHNQWSLDDVIGVVESAELGPTGGTAWVRFDRGEAGEDALRKVADGILRNISVGYLVYKMISVDAGEDQIPVMRAVDWEPHEISLVPVGADADSVTRSAGGRTRCEFIIQERAMPETTLTTPITISTPEPMEVTVMSADPAEPAAGDSGSGDSTAPATGAAAADAGDARAREARAAERERERVLGIQRVGRALKRPEAEIDGAIRRGLSLERFRAAAVDALAAAPAEGGGVIQFDRRDPRVEPGEDARDKWLRGAQAWIIQRAAVANIVGAAAKQRGEQVDLDPGEFRGLRMIDLARQSLERAGVNTKRMLPMELIGAAFTHRSGGMATTSDFPILLENTLHKVLLSAYDVTPDKWSRFCSRGTVSDFKPHKRYRMGSFGALSAVNEHGEFTSKSIPDGERQSQQAATKGNIIGITRQAIINDDLGAFSTLATALGRSARLSVEVDVFALLAQNSGLGPTMTDGNTLFHASHGNIGTGAALSAAALDADRVVMGLQEDPSGNELLELRPSILLVPIGLGGQARVINDSQYDPDTVANKAQMKANIAGKMFNDIVDTGRISGTRRYLFCDPAIAPVIEVAFLDGQEAPYMEMKEGWLVDGVEWKVRLDFGVAAVDHRGAVTNAGQ